MSEQRATLYKIVNPLIDWYRVNRRPLPWRSEATPYRVWVSEIMLQQTRIEAAMPYFQRFVSAFPNVEALAEAEDERLMKLWEGLGYYSRARNLKKAARMIVETYGGILPPEAAELRKLPGIGDYTAGAIASIAYGRPEPAVDGNVLRVVMRLLACDEDVMKAATRKWVAQLLRELYPSGEESGLFTEGLMELGERVCIPNGEPQCSLCPLAEHCLAHREGTPARYPLRVAKTSRRVEERTVLLLRCGERYAIRRREETGLLAGLWELPSYPGDLSEEERKALLPEGRDWQPCGRAKHIFSHVEWHMQGYAAICPEETEDFLWVTAEELRGVYALPAAFRAYVKQIL